MKLLRSVSVLVLSIAGLALAPLTANAESKPESIRYADRNEDSKVRFVVRGDHVVNIVASADATCRRNGEIVEPWMGSGVTSGFNRTALQDSGEFRSKQIYRRRNPFTKKVEPMTRIIEGQVGENVTARVNIRYTVSVHRFGKAQATCRTGVLRFNPELVGNG